MLHGTTLRGISAVAMEPGGHRSGFDAIPSAGIGGSFGSRIGYVLLLIVDLVLLIVELILHLVLRVVGITQRGLIGWVVSVGIAASGVG